jgi:hypothetical protein
MGEGGLEQHQNDGDGEERGTKEEKIRTRCGPGCRSEGKESIEKRLPATEPEARCRFPVAGKDSQLSVNRLRPYWGPQADCGPWDDIG